jgi:hypothetical protein
MGISGAQSPVSVSQLHHYSKSIAVGMVARKPVSFDDYESIDEILVNETAPRAASP